MSTTVIRFRCEVCGERIERDKGYVGASFAQVRADLPVEWFAAHYTCRPDDDAYWIDAHRIESVADIAWWREHLSWKNWWAPDSWDALTAVTLLDSLSAPPPAVRLPSQQHPADAPVS